MPLLTIKSANRLKTSYGDTFEKLLEFLDQKYHFQETFDTKTQKLVLKREKKTCPAFNSKTRKWA